MNKVKTTLASQKEKKGFLSDQRAFEKFYELSRGEVQQYLTRRIAMRGESEDISQEVWRKFLSWPRLVELESEEEARGYLFRFVHNEWVNYLRKRLKEPKMESLDEFTGDSSTYREIVDTQDDDPLRSWIMKEEQNEMSEEASKYLQQLSQKEREVYVLMEQEFNTLSEIAKRLGVSRDVVYQRLHRAREKIRALGKENEERRQ